MSEIIISKHALERLQQRRNLKHIGRHINKINSWGLPVDGITEHKGYRYVTKNGVLVTVLPPTKTFYRQLRLGETEL